MVVILEAVRYSQTEVVTIAAPYYYDYINSKTSIITPSTVHVSNTGLARFFHRALMERAMSVYKWSVPDNWDLDYFRAVLYYWGYAAIINTDLFGVIPQECGLGGYNVYMRPRYVLVNNPLIRPSSREIVIDRDCCLIKLRSDYRGLHDFVTYYGNLLALIAETMSVNILNSKLSYIFVAKNKGVAEALKKLYDIIASGEPAAFVDKDLFEADGSPLWQFLTQNVGQNYVADRLLIDYNKLLHDFDTQVGLPNTNTDKRERLNAEEVHGNDAATYAAAADRLDRLQADCKKVKSMFGVDVSVDWRFPPDKMGGADDEVDTVNMGPAAGKP